MQADHHSDPLKIELDIDQDDKVRWYFGRRRIW